MTADDRFGLRNTLSLLWHLSNNWGHGKTLFYDVRADAVRCGCGKTWGADSTARQEMRLTKCDCGSTGFARKDVDFGCGFCGTVHRVGEKS